jgi:hypothetical protein
VNTPIASPAVVTAAHLERDPLKKDFRNFMHKTWMTVFDNAPSDLLYEFGHRLQYGPRKDILMGFRGMAKSYTVVDYAMWRLYCDPTEIVLTVSGSGDGAKGNAQLAWGWLQTFDWLAHMRPKGIDRSSTLAFDVAGSRHEKCESFAALSLFGQLTGRRSSLIIPDDIETPNTSSTEGDRTEMRRRAAEMGGALLKPGGQVKMLGTPQHEQTIYIEYARDKGYGMRIWPVTYPIIDELNPKRDELHRYGMWLAPSVLKAVTANPSLAGCLVDDSRFSVEDLFERKLEYGSVEYDRQFRLFLDAGAGDERPLKLRDIPVIEIAVPQPHAIPPIPLKVPAQIVWDGPLAANKWGDIEVDSLSGDGAVYAPQSVAHWTLPEQKVCVIDPSGMGLDETAWEIQAGLYGRVYVCKQDARLEGFTEETMKAIALDCALYGVNKVVIEKNYGGGMFGELLRPHLIAINKPVGGVKPYPHWEGCEIEELLAGNVQKEVRILDTLTPFVTGHRLVIAAEVLRKDFPVEYTNVEVSKRRYYRLTYQLTRLSKQRGSVAHDDRVDVMASGVATFMGTLRRQVAEAAQAAKDKYLEEETDKLIASRRKLGLPVLGDKSSGGRLGVFAGDNHSGGLNESALFTGRRR